MSRGAQVIDRPRRWDLPFSRDVADPRQSREMTDEDVDRLLSLEPFRSMDPEKFPKATPLAGILKNDTRIRRYKHGDVIVRQGDYGNSAFLILEGYVRVFMEGLDPAALGRRDRERNSRLRSLAQLLTNPRSPEVRDARDYKQPREGGVAREEDRETLLVQDVTNVLVFSPDAFKKKTSNVMKAGELFGELAALGRIPRAATVASFGDSRLLEVRWQGLRDLRKYDDALRRHTDDQYRKFGLSATLRAAPLLANLEDEEVRRIAQVAEFETYGKFDWYGSYLQQRQRDRAEPLAEEPIIAVEGHYPNGLILIRAGFARLSRRYGSGERTFSYLGKGDVYGFAELAHNARHQDQVSLSATLRAVGYVDVVRIPTKIFEELILPSIPPDTIPPLPSEADGVPAPGRRSAAAPHQHRELEPAMMEFVVEHRFMNGTASMIIDLDRCTRCDECVHACASGHTNNPRFIRHGEIFGHYMVANACMHCVDPVCMIGCPTGAIHRDMSGGEVVINDITCIGCGTCAASCPYDNIRLVEVRDRSRRAAIMIDPGVGQPIVKATKCDLCVDHHGGPACERACPHDALVRVDMRELDVLAKWLKR